MKTLKNNQIFNNYVINIGSSSDENFYTDYFKWHVVYGLLAI